MPRRTETASEEKKGTIALSDRNGEGEDELTRLNRLLGAVMRYISDDEIAEIDIEYLLENTEGLRKWWDDYREKDRKRVEDEIKKSLGGLSLEELEKIREQIHEKRKNE
jgi:hypothetical protein